MVAERKSVDLDDAPEWASLADEVTTTRRSIVLRKGGKDLALVVPIDDSSPFAPGRAKTPDDLEAFLGSAGGWQGIVDEEYMEEVYRGRSISSRPPVEL